MIPRPRRRHDSDPQDPERTAGPAGIVRRAFGHEPSPEQELERVLSERSAELEDYAAQFEETVVELGRREERLRDERASVERLVRRSTAELEAREKELIAFERELRQREEALAVSESELARRRSDLGAVERKRAALEQRERALESRESSLEERESRLTDGAETPSAGVASAPAQLCFVPGASYRLVEIAPTELGPGRAVQIEGEEYLVARIGRSPLPGDARRCAYLARGLPRSPEPNGNV
jgi:uncharacterized protein (DUF3084 family)